MGISISISFMNIEPSSQYGFQKNITQHRGAFIFVYVFFEFGIWVLLFFFEINLTVFLGCFCFFKINLTVAYSCINLVCFMAISPLFPL